MNEVIIHIPELLNNSSKCSGLNDLIKIGIPSLVAIISSYMSYLIAKKNKELEKEIQNIKNIDEKKKFLMDNKIKNIEIASDKLEEYFDATSKLFSRVGGIIRDYAINKTPLEEFSESQFKLIQERDSLFIQSAESRNYALSRFHLLGADNIINELNKFNEFTQDFRNSIIFNRKCHSLIEYEEKIEELKKLKNNVYKSVASFYSFDITNIRNE